VEWTAQLTGKGRHIEIPSQDNVTASSKIDTMPLLFRTVPDRSPEERDDNATAGEDMVGWRKIVEVLGVMCNETKSLRQIVM